MWQHHLGDEVVTDILTRLPLKSIIRFMCVSKSWHTLISSSHFISSHLRTTLNSKNNNSQIFLHKSALIHFRFCRLLLLEESHQNNHYRSMLSILTLEPPCTLHIIGSTGGLICFAVIHDQQNKDLISKFIILNPEIGNFLIIPPPLQSMKSYDVVQGFGFDDTTLDYKIFLAEPDRYVYLYSLNSRSWRHISCEKTWYETNPYAIFVKGCFHWMAYDYVGHPRAENPPFIMVFDIKSETFGQILFQEPLVGRLNVIAGFGESSIGVIQQLRSIPAYVWLMEQNGSWLKIAEAVYEGGGRRVLGFKNKDELLIRFLNGSIVSQNTRNDEVRDVIKTEVMSYRYSLHTHVPSLVLLDKMIA